MERFEAEHGTLTSLLLFFGRTWNCDCSMTIESTADTSLSPVHNSCTDVYVPGKGHSSDEHYSSWGQVRVMPGHWTLEHYLLILDSVWVFMLLANEGVKTYRSNPTFSLGTTRIPTWTTPIITVLFVSFLVPSTSFLGHTCGLAVGYGCKLFLHFDSYYSWLISCTGGFGYLRFLAPPEKILRWIEGKMNLLGRLPHYVSVDQKTYGRYGVLPTVNGSTSTISESGISLGHRLGPWADVIICPPWILYAKYVVNE